MWFPVGLLSVFLVGVSAAAPLTARIELDAEKRSPAISRNLFGKFTEHLGRNVYLGMWAQVIPNPEFAPYSAWPDPQRLIRQTTRYFEEFHLTGSPSDMSKKGIAASWGAAGTVRGEVERSGVEYVQRILTGEEGGRLETGIYPPFYRVPYLALILKARSEAPTLVGVSVLNSRGQTVVHREVPLSSEMALTEYQLRMEKGVSVAKGEPCVLVLDFEAGLDVELARIQVFAGDHMKGWESEVVGYMKSARLPMLRFPGGNFASGYHWEDGVGPLSERPVLPNPAWKGVMEWNHVGTDEWLTLCELTGAEPLICVNAGDGTAEEARRWVEYCNGSIDTPMGKWRAQNGHPEPYDVRYWEIGNELYGSWQIGHTNAEGYAARYDEFVRAVETVDPEILIIANGRDSEWNRTFVQRATEPVRSLSVHSLPGGGTPASADPQVVFSEFMAHTDAYGEYLHSLAAPMREKGLEARLAVTELQVFTNRPTLPNNATLTEALWTAGIIHACIRSEVVELLTHSAMLNHGGGLKKVRGVVYPNPVWWTTHLYGTAGCAFPTNSTVLCPTFSTQGKWLTERQGVPYLDVMGLLSSDSTRWTAFVINRHSEEMIEAEVVLMGFEAASVVQVETLTGESFMARNEWDSCTVAPSEKQILLRDASLNHQFPPASLTRFTFTSR